MSDVRLYRGKRPVVIPLETVFKVMEIILRGEHAEAFLTLCREQGLSVEAEGAVVNAVKLHLADHAAHTRDLFAARVQHSPVDPGPPPSCFPKTRTVRTRNADRTKKP